MKKARAAPLHEPPLDCRDSLFPPSRAIFGFHKRHLERQVLKKDSHARNL
jgi:hypothetical protein